MQQYDTNTQQIEYNPPSKQYPPTPLNTILTMSTHGRESASAGDCYMAKWGAGAGHLQAAIAGLILSEHVPEGRLILRRAEP